ncbi:hypothetical protein DY000_02020781 [Brassica cretica]|uniref:Uncharacterized protein n=1 Tax=Brassica cretica TaxID=69181 RepID=A0ABQ7EL94_BRACR|nr:hypothetical protein DY000_02020781 [Brassica cretica]
MAVVRPRADVAEVRPCAGPCRPNGDPQPLIVGDSVIVVPRFLYLTVSTGRALRRFASVVGVVKERDRFVFVLAWPRVLVANWWCGGAALLPPTSNQKP